MTVIRVTQSSMLLQLALQVDRQGCTHCHITPSCICDVKPSHLDRPRSRITFLHGYGFCLATSRAIPKKQLNLQGRRWQCVIPDGWPEQLQKDITWTSMWVLPGKLWAPIQQ